MMTYEELQAIKARAIVAGIDYADPRDTQRCIREDVPALVAEVERLRALITETVPVFETLARVSFAEYGNVDGCADRDDALLEKLKAM